MNEINFDNWADDPAIRDAILREASQEILWDSEEIVPQELDDF